MHSSSFARQDVAASAKPVVLEQRDDGRSAGKVAAALAVAAAAADLKGSGAHAQQEEEAHDEIAAQLARMEQGDDDDASGNGRTQGSGEIVI